MIIVQTTLDEEKKAKELINLLLETNKIACGTYHTIQSSYKWNNELVNETEFEISLYTNESSMHSVVEIVTERHNYELPKVTVLEPTFTLPEYDEWVSNETF